MSSSIRFLFVLAIFAALLPTSIVADPSTTHGPRTSFKEGKIKIGLPVQLVKSNAGYLLERDFNDGGTRMFTIIDTSGASIDVFIDHRLDKGNNWGTVYLYAYPDSPGSIRIINQAKFKKEVLVPIGIKS